MDREPPGASVGSPVAFAAHAVRRGWNNARTVYYANSVSWRVLKSGALLFFGFFLWSSTNLLLSYQPSWTWLRYPMAYGFVLVWYGPLHHLVVIPLSVRLRRRPDDWSRLGRHLPNGGLAVFFALVVVLGTFPAGPMTFEFGSVGGDGADVDPQLLCTKSTTGADVTVHCHLDDSRGIDRVVVESGGERIAVDEQPPFEFTVRDSEMAEVAGQKQFQVVLQDEDGETIRRYTRMLGMVPAG